MFNSTKAKSEGIKIEVSTNEHILVEMNIF